MGKYGKWSRNWEQFDWEPIDRELKEVIKDIGTDRNVDVGISREEVIEYFEWLSENRPEEFWAFLFFTFYKHMVIFCKNSTLSASHLFTYNI